jgi:tetratricopeptide (TPR) repeat protein
MGGSGVSAQPVKPPSLLIHYQQYLDYQDSSQFVAQVSHHYTAGTLERLAKHPSREVRRAAVLALSSLGDYASNHALGCAMLDEDRTVRTIAEDGIRTLWTRAGNESERQELGIAIRLNAARLYKEALYRASRLIERAPWFAEAWYQRSVAHASMGLLIESIRDCHQALEINPYHFVAATSMGQSYLQLKNPVSALDCFRRALRLNPNLEGVRAQVARLMKMVEDKS